MNCNLETITKHIATLQENNKDADKQPEIENLGNLV